MTPNSPSEVLELTVELDYGQFYLIGRRIQHSGGADPILQLLDTAVRGAGIASSEGNEEEGLFYESPTLPGETIPVPPARYGAWITGRGFVNRGCPGRQDPAMRGGCSCGRYPNRFRRAGCAPGRVRHQRLPDLGAQRRRPPGPMEHADAAAVS
jgi:hypothetical protein